MPRHALLLFLPPSLARHFATPLRRLHFCHAFAADIFAASAADYFRHFAR